ncbi:MAG: hypothetical protein QOH68_3873 [Nocardioidaceae bacterium]|jgi:hypothetical protein|nr:hypothetical protein [Nocardioidaceae bacterium]
MKDRRPAFFGTAALVCFGLVPVAQTDFRGFAVGLGTLYVVLSLLSLLDSRTRGRSRSGSGSR